jgi:hypothetical protein
MTRVAPLYAVKQQGWHKGQKGETHFPPTQLVGEVAHSPTWRGRRGNPSKFQCRRTFAASGALFDRQSAKGREFALLPVISRYELRSPAVEVPLARHTLNYQDAGTAVPNLLNFKPSTEAVGPRSILMLSAVQKSLRIKTVAETH